jgi:hypothetical protein
VALLIFCFVLAVVVPIAVGVVAHRAGWSLAGGPLAWGAAAARRFGRAGGTLLIVVVGWVVTIAVGLALGFLAKSLQSSVDEPIFNWVHPRVPGGSEFTTLNAKLTLIGNLPIIQLVVLVAGIVLAFAYRRRWWLPVIALLVALFGEKYLQKLLGKVVDRGHPPTTLGTYPSGGVGRILAIYGVVMVLVIVLQPRLSRAWRAGLWTGVATAAVVEAFTRVYLSKHWFTDALFGLVFGTLLLLTHVAAVSAAAGAAADSPTALPPPGGAPADGASDTSDDDLVSRPAAP